VPLRGHQFFRALSAHHFRVVGRICRLTVAYGASWRFAPGGRSPGRPGGGCISGRDSRGRRNIVIRVQPATVHISPFGFHRYAKEYFRAALAYEPADGFSPVRYYLVCHAIEVCLKAFLLGKGVPKTKLKNPNLLGHDLVKVLARSRACGLDTYRPLTADEEGTCPGERVLFEQGLRVL
jgi:hypothetical protein